MRQSHRWYQHHVHLFACLAFVETDMDFVVVVAAVTAADKDAAIAFVSGCYCCCYCSYCGSSTSSEDEEVEQFEQF